MPQPEITQEFLRSVLHYNRLTGIFTWRERSDVRPQWNGRYAGKQAGYKWTPDGGANWYIVIRLLDWPFGAHRLAVLYVTGRWPIIEVDHRDGDGLNNRWLNIRRATKTQNGYNRGATKRSSTGVKGVTARRNGTFAASIQAKGKWKHIGTFTSLEMAGAAYEEAAQKLHGKFARTS